MLMLLVRFIDRLVGAVIALSAPDASRGPRAVVAMFVLTAAVLAVCTAMLLLAWQAVPR